VGPLGEQPGRGLVRPAQRLPRAVRDVPAAAARGARPRRGHPRRPQQQHARVMSVTRVIRYVTKPECAEENARLIGAVFADLVALKPEGVQYQSFRLDDGLTFVHVVTLAGQGNPLLASEAFQAFSSTVADRCTEGPG